jgi:hypothetical protein
MMFCPLDFPNTRMTQSIQRDLPKTPKMAVPQVEASEPECLAQLLLDSVTFTTSSVCEPKSFDLVVDICLKVIEIIRDRKQAYFECSSPSDSKVSSKTLSTPSLTLLSNDTIQDICSYLDIKSKCMARFTSSSVHGAMMRCPLNTCSYGGGEALFFHFRDLLPIMKKITPMRLWQSLSRKLCCCNSDVARQLKLIDPNTLVLNHSCNHMSLSELNSLGFDRSWTISGIRINDQTMKSYKSLCKLLLLNGCHTSLRVLEFNLSDSTI